jgi:hypothetical protein
VFMSGALCGGMGLSPLKLNNFLCHNSASSIHINYYVIGT